MAEMNNGRLHDPGNRIDEDNLEKINGGLADTENFILESESEDPSIVVPPIMGETVIPSLPNAMPRPKPGGLGSQAPKP